MKKKILFGGIGATIFAVLLVLGGWFYTAQVYAAPTAKAQIKSGMIGLTPSTVMRINVVNLGKTDVTGVVKFADGQGKIGSFQCDLHLTPGQAMWMDVKGSEQVTGDFSRAEFRAIVVVNDSTLVQNVNPTIEIYHAEGGNTIAFYSFK